MTFEDVIQDLYALKGLLLTPLSKGAALVIEDVDVQAERVLITTETGVKKSRPFSELRKIWNELCAKPAVHVDSVLAGSGSSRNQPETILASLPYIEYLFIDRKKHLAFTGTPVHAAGTVQKMDPLKAECVRNRLKSPDDEPLLPHSIIVTDDLLNTCRTLEELSGTEPEALDGKPGVYFFTQGKNRIAVLDKQLISGTVREGNYIVFEGNVNGKMESYIELSSYSVFFFSTLQHCYAVITK